MLLTTPTFLSFLEERSLRTNNSSSHIISHCIHPILITLSSSLLFFPRLPFLQLYCSPSLPQFSSIHFVSLQSELYWFSHGLSCHISISLNSLTCWIFCSLQCCFHFHKYTYTQFLTLFPPHNFSVSGTLWQAHSVSAPFQILLLISPSTCLLFFLNTRLAVSSSLKLCPTHLWRFSDFFISPLLTPLFMLELLCDFLFEVAHSVSECLLLLLSKAMCIWRAFGAQLQKDFLANWGNFSFLYATQKHTWCLAVDLRL